MQIICINYEDKNIHLHLSFLIASTVLCAVNSCAIFNLRIHFNECLFAEFLFFRTSTYGLFEVLYISIASSRCLFTLAIIRGFADSLYYSMSLFPSFLFLPLIAPFPCLGTSQVFYIFVSSKIGET